MPAAGRSGRRLRLERNPGLVAVLGEEEHPRYFVQWEDAHESILYPSEGTTIQPNEDTAAGTD